MKRIILFCAVLGCAMLISACTKDKTVEGSGEGKYKAEILSFGFYAEDNPDVLNLDYPGTVSGNTIKVVMPAIIDRSALKARFTVADKNTVKVGELLFESGKTVFDYGKTVDFTVNDPVSAFTKIFTMKVVKPTNLKWIQKGELASAFNPNVTLSVTEFIMRMNPAEQVPYLAYLAQEKVEGVNTIKMSVARWNGTTFEGVGPEVFTPKVSAGGIGLDFDNKGKPFVLFLDPEANTCATVMSYDGMNWSTVGSPAFSSKVNYKLGVALGVDAQGYPVVMTVGNDKAFPAYRTLECAYFNGASWVSRMTVPGRPVTGSSPYMPYSTKALRFGDYVYFATTNAGKTDGVPNGNSIYKYANGTFSRVVEGGLIDPKSSDTSTQDISFDIAPDGTIYLLTADDVAGAWQLQVFTYKEGDATPKMFGGKIPHVVEALSGYRIALDKNGVPYVAFNQSKASPVLTYVKYDKEQGRWTDPIVVDDNRITPATIFIGFDDNNQGYLGAGSATPAPYVYRLYKLMKVDDYGNEIEDEAAVE